MSDLSAPNVSNRVYKIKSHDRKFLEVSNSSSKVDLSHKFESYSRKNQICENLPVLIIYLYSLEYSSARNIIYINTYLLSFLPWSS